MKIMIVSSKIKHKSKTILGGIRNPVLNFILSFVTAYMRKRTLHMQHQHRVQHKIHYTSLEEVSKKYFMTNNLQQ